MQRGQSLSLNFIILAVIAVAILLIILFLIADKTGILAQNIEKDCKPKEDGRCPQGTVDSWIKDDDGNMKKCCVPIGVG